MSRRKRLIRRTALLCSIPVVIGTAAVLVLRRTPDVPYVAGQEQEGITRSLERGQSAGGSGLHFTEMGAAAGIHFEHFPATRTSQLPEDMGSGVAWGDYDGDGLPDLFLVNFAAPLGVSEEEMAAAGAHDQLYRNRGDGSFEDVSTPAGVGFAHRGMGAAWGDYDGDGDLDLFVTSFGENLLWENRRGHFVDVTARAGLSGRGFWTGASWSDFDLDGDLDLYVCGYVNYIPEPAGRAHKHGSGTEFPFTLNPSSYLPQANRLFVNRGDGTFEDRAETAGVANESGRSLSAAWADFDADGLPDLYVANDVSDNALYRNRGDGSFENISYQSMAADYRGAMGIAVGDWDGDLDLDLFLTHWIAQENALYSNGLDQHASGDRQSGLVFRDEADRVGLGQISLDLIGWGTAFVDLDNDGRLDLFAANGSTFQRRDDPTRLVAMDPHLYWNGGVERGFFEVGADAGIRTQPGGVGRGAAFADYDRDGDLDLAVVRHGGRARLLRNDSEGGHWIAFRLEARSGHPSALGAQLIVRSGGRALLREVGAGSSYLSQNDSEVVVGLGDLPNDERIESVEINWPGGHRDRWPELEADRRYTVVEGQVPRGVSVAGSEGPPQRRRISRVSKNAVVSDVKSKMNPQQRRRFWALAKQAQRLFARREWAEAAELFAQMSDLDPSHEDALYDRGNCLLELGRYQEAERSFERLTRLNPTSARAWLQLGLLHSLPNATELWNLDSAVAAFERAHHIHREESGPLALWGEAAVAQGRFEIARDLLQSAYRMNPNASEALYLAGYLAWKRGESEHAGELLERARRSLREKTPSRGVGEQSDARFPELTTSHRRTAERRLFANCLEGLRQSPDSPEPDSVFRCVERLRSALPDSTS